MIKVILILLLLAWIWIIVELRNAPTDKELWEEEVE
jgi:hypothetical protein